MRPWSGAAKLTRRAVGCRSTRARYAGFRRQYHVLAIETSCDDTSVAIVEYCPDGPHFKAQNALNVEFHEKVTASNDGYGGIHPLVALHSHRSNLANLIKKGLDQTFNNHNSSVENGRPKFIAVTCGPGMRSNLSVGIDTAKGLALAYGVPFVGVHHMQAHALTSRLVSAMSNPQDAKLNAKHSGTDTFVLNPGFPFLSLLVSGGHTMLIESSGLTLHRTIAETQDIAVGDLLDKAARAILPSALLKPPSGQALEQFAFTTKFATNVFGGDKSFPSDDADTSDPESDNMDYDYVPPARRHDELKMRPTKWGWSLAPPLSESKGGDKSSRRMAYSFSGLLSFVERIINQRVFARGSIAQELPQIAMAERQDMAREVQRIAFEHLASRIILHLGSVRDDFKGDTIVVSGGVASNQFLRHVLRSILDVRGYGHIKLSFPPVELCTDNALMIAWAGIEMYEAGYRSTLDIQPLRKWSMDPDAEDGGILGVGGWLKRAKRKEGGLKPKTDDSGEWECMCWAGLS